MSPRKSFTPKPPRPPQPPAAPAGLGMRRRKIGAIADIPLRPTGPRWLRLFELPHEQPDFCVPPPEFVGTIGVQHSSGYEWMIGSALAKVTNDPPNWRDWVKLGGGLTWTWQDPLLGGRQTRGGQVCDFNVHWGTEEVCFRVTTSYFHLQAEAAQKADELYEKSHGDRTVDLYDTYFAHDCSLAAACRVVADALAGRELPNPATLGTFEPVQRRGGQ